MTPETMLEYAIELANNFHKGQRDKVGLPVILHPLRVMEAGRNLDEKIVGVLHDTLEDTELTWNDLEDVGFPRYITNAVIALTHLKGETRNNYYHRILTVPLAIAVKEHDVKDNWARIFSVPDWETRERLYKKYDHAARFMGFKL